MKHASFCATEPSAGHLRQHGPATANLSYVSRKPWPAASSSAWVPAKPTPNLPVELLIPFRFFVTFDLTSVRPRCLIPSHQPPSSAAHNQLDGAR